MPPFVTLIAHNYTIPPAGTQCGLDYSRLHYITTTHTEQSIRERIPGIHTFFFPP